jgi:hypothetical protein
MDRLGDDMDGVARLHLNLFQLAIDLDLIQHSARMQVDRFFLKVVILEAQRVTGVDVENLADIACGLGPMKLVTPWFLHTRHDVLHSLSLGSDFVLRNFIFQAVLDLFDCA